jgi:transposase InsO family protein
MRCAGVSVRVFGLCRGSFHRRCRPWGGGSIFARRRLMMPRSSRPKVERFHGTLADEWAYARLYKSDTERCQEFTTWLHTYNHYRGHTALGGQPPASRAPNLSGQYN